MLSIAKANTYYQYRHGLNLATFLSNWGRPNIGKNPRQLNQDRLVGLTRLASLQENYDQVQVQLEKGRCKELGTVGVSCYQEIECGRKYHLLETQESYI